MSELRDRIAAVDEIHVQLTAMTDGWQCRCGEKFVDSTTALREWRLHKADAVIAELGRCYENTLQSTIFAATRIRALAETWHQDYDPIPANDPRNPTDADIAYDDAGFQILLTIAEKTA